MRSTISMKNLFFGILLVTILTAFTSDQGLFYPRVKNDSFTKGEVLDYKMSYGIFTVGRGSTNIDTKYFSINNRQCFKVEVTGKTVGMVSWVSDVDDRWGAYIDTVALVPHMTYRKIREGKYKKDEVVNFDHAKGKVQAKVFNHKTGTFKEPVEHDAPQYVRDLISGFMYLRTQDLSKTKPGDTVIVSGFFEDSVYNLKVVFKGRQTIKTKAGKFRALVFKPSMPKNSLFDGKDSITAWFSDDKNRIILKVEAQMFIGSAGVELTGYRGVKNPLNIVR